MAQVNQALTQPPGQSPGQPLAQSGAAADATRGVPEPLRILVTTKHLHPDAHQLFAAAGATVRVIDQYEPAEALERAMAEWNPHGVIARTIAVTARAIAAAPALRVIAKTGSGFDNIDLATATHLGIPVVYSYGANSPAVAEMALGMMFALARNLARHDRRIRAGEWSRFAFAAYELRNQTLGIVGYGQSGQHLARIAQGIGMHVAVWAPRYRYEQPPESVRVAASLHELLGSVDIVSLHCPLNASSHGLIDRAAIAALRPGAWLINIARGPVIDEPALLEGLASGQIGAAGLDSHVTEPLPADHPLLGFDNVVLTPHVGGSTLQSTARMHPLAARNVLAVLTGGKVDPRGVANPEVLGQRPI